MLDQQTAQPSSSYYLVLEDIESRDRAALQIELVDVNDNAPRFLGGPFPLQLVIPAVGLHHNFYQKNKKNTNFSLHRYCFFSSHAILCRNNYNLQKKKCFTMTSDHCQAHMQIAILCGNYVLLKKKTGRPA